MSQPADVVIIGAGIIGGSIAFHLLERDPGLRVVMLEKLLDGRTDSMDIRALSLDRFAAGRLRAEANMF